MTQEFQLSVTPVGPQDFLVRVERVAPGVSLGEEQVSWPIDDWLERARQIFANPLSDLFEDRGLAVLEAPVAPLAGPELALVALGQELYNALFQGSIRDSWLSAQGIAQNRQDVLRLRLLLKGDRLPRLPWEVMHVDSHPLTAGAHVTFSRCHPSYGSLGRNGGLTAKPLPMVLRVLMVLAAPTNQAALELEQEAHQLQEELEKHRLNDRKAILPEIELHILKQPGREELTQVLEQGHYQVFHFSGHSNSGPSGGMLHLVNATTGLDEVLSGDDLSGLLANNGTWLAVLNSCRGAQAASQSEPLERDHTLAETLVRRGIPSVLAMADRIPDQVALTLSRLFYRNLKFGYPVDLSLCRARQGLISAYGSHQFYWALPILYLQDDFEGHLVMRGRALGDQLLTPSVQAEVSAWGDGLDALDLGLNFGMDLGPLAADRDELPGLAQPGLGDGDPFSEFVFEPDDAFSQDVEELEQIALSNGSAPVGSAAIGPAAQTPGLADVQRAGFVAAGVAAGVTAAESVATQAKGEQPMPSGAMTEAPKAPIEPSGMVIQVPPDRRSGPSKSLLLAGAGLLCLLGLGFGAVQMSRSPMAKPSPTAIAVTDKSALLAQAMRALEQGDIEQAKPAIEALLDQSALREARVALSGVPPERAGNGEMKFLWGRLAWQAAQGGQLDYSVDDARRQWQLSVDQDAQMKAVDGKVRRNALAFAYYTEGDTRRARQLWLEVLGVADVPAGPTAGAVRDGSRDSLTAYAGLALLAARSARVSPVGQQGAGLTQASQLYGVVVGADPINFTLDELKNNWLWTEGMLREWQELAKVSR
jgi:hypothetical protein